MARILLADDHELIRKGLRAIIEGNKDWLICGEATNGQEAIERTIELQPDLIILDVTMPVLNGLQAARQIRELWRRESNPRKETAFRRDCESARPSNRTCRLFYDYA